MLLAKGMMLALALAAVGAQPTGSTDEPSSTTWRPDLMINTHLKWYAEDSLPDIRDHLRLEPDNNLHLVDIESADKYTDEPFLDLYNMHLVVNDTKGHISNKHCKVKVLKDFGQPSKVTRIDCLDDCEPPPTPSNE